MNAIRKTLAAYVAVLLLPAVAPAQDVFKEISTQRLESILGDMKIDYKRSDDNKGNYFYDYKTNNLNVRLTNFNGKDLMIDLYLAAIDWKEVNRWNLTAKFSRANLRKDSKGLDAVVLESNLDLVGGVTEDTIKHFVRTFDKEISSFTNFSTPAVAEEEIYKGIPAARLEKILEGMNIKYKKGKGAGPNDFSYDFNKEFNKINYAIRLTNFNNEDLMIDVVFKASPVAKINAWNVKRSYIRAVLYPGGGMPYTALESNLDCVGGTNDNIVRYFINSFDIEVREFDKYLQAQ